MALNKEELRGNIIGIMEDMLSREDTSIEEFAERLSDAMDVFVKGADVNYQDGLIAPSGGGAVTGVLNTTIN